MTKDLFIVRHATAEDNGNLTVVRDYDRELISKGIMEAAKVGRYLSEYFPAIEAIYSSGAARALSLVIPELKGKFDGFALRVPIPDGSITDFTAILSKEASADEVNAAFEKAAGGSLRGILEYQTDPIVSADIVHNPHSCILDSPSTMADGTMVKVVGWYDNEWGYANRTVDVAKLLMDRANG